MKELTLEQRAIKDLITVMEIQENRESEAFHISVHAFRPMWDRAKDAGREVLKNAGYILDKHGELYNGS